MRIIEDHWWNFWFVWHHVRYFFWFRLRTDVCQKKERIWNYTRTKRLKIEKNCWFLRAGTFYLDQTLETLKNVFLFVLNLNLVIFKVTSLGYYKLFFVTYTFFVCRWSNFYLDIFPIPICLLHSWEHTCHHPVGFLCSALLSNCGITNLIRRSNNMLSLLCVNRSMLCWNMRKTIVNIHRFWSQFSQTK